MDDSLQSALKILPHGPEFRFVDRLLSMDGGKTGVGEYRVRGDEPFLKGHFPNAPLFPGVLMVEAAAQLTGVVAQNDPDYPPIHDLKLAGMRGIKILGSARPGETIRIEAQVTKRWDTLVQATVHASVNGQVVLTGELTLGGSAA
jgi:3-hydroxymyristoyl/3-hydroxydecanoyl-(acyl carrier protein) dehydratase